jgi:hypothetical protein
MAAIGKKKGARRRLDNAELQCACCIAAPLAAQGDHGSKATVSESLFTLRAITHGELSAKQNFKQLRMKVTCTLALL